MLFHRHAKSETTPAAPRLSERTKSSYGVPKTIEEILAISVSPRPPNPPPHGPGTVSSNSPASGNTQSQAYRKNTPPKRAPSRRTCHATIHTDAIDGRAAFESDAFAVYMPTTRVPILEQTRPERSQDGPTKAQIEAYETYKKKAQQAREKNDSIGVRVPSYIASYDYANASTQRAEKLTHGSPTETPPMPAGAFPVSPPMKQDAWSKPARTSEAQTRATKSASTASNTPVARTSNRFSGSTNMTTTVTKERIEYSQADCLAGARPTPSSSPKPVTIKLRMKPKLVPTHPVQQESRSTLYVRPSILRTTSASTTMTRSTSPTKTMPNFTRQNSVEGDSIFGYRLKDPARTVEGATAPPEPNEKAKEKAKDKDREILQKLSPAQRLPPAPKRSLTDRIPWFRPTPPRITTQPPTPDDTPTTTAAVAPAKKPHDGKETGYIDPFALLSPSPPSPRRRPRAAPTHAAPSLPLPLAPKPTPLSPRFNAGVAQITSLALLVLKICIAIYSAVAVWYLLDAVREALCFVRAPFRAAAWVGGALCVVLRCVGRAVWVCGGEAVVRAVRGVLVSLCGMVGRVWW